MRTLTTSAHLEPDTTTRVNVFAPTPGEDGFVSLRVGGEFIDVALIAQPGCADALRALARAAEEAAVALDCIAEIAPEGAA
ncbi:hypothetical protein ACFOZ0_20395 [Streptomyces yaanensis]|uniref:Uncharacterized protein n=1 Tax=Streptomyces yaanensis TaxID=1142239 RepID=A0ABV7SGE4_9ACTN|nr:hypothetical protein [Streptomyces sp. CGMCC 4.7035]WNB97793.1 hypothetical protein Q2K21_06705 [Streptomyces sp. CGMCC 4.7035]